MAGESGKSGPSSDEREQQPGEGQPFDLLMSSKEKCDIFKVVFDFYTPRPHFIILPRDTRKGDYDSLDQGARLKVVKVAKAMVSHYNLQKSAILSLHFGSWISTHQIFHAHICVDVEDYLCIFEKKEGSGDYAEKVRKYDPISYFREEVEAIEKYREGTIPPQPPFTIIYHPSEPRVGFAVEKLRRGNGESLLEAMINFANPQRNLTDQSAKDQNDGCHVCLVLDGKAHGFDLEESQSLGGYIQVTGLKFYRDLCPPEKQEDWFKQFSSKEDYKVYT